jgi:DNA-binding transcriptional MerR regulator
MINPESGEKSPQPSPGQGVYGIGVTSGLVGTGVQNLRAYEKAGLVEPDRTPGGSRLYSSDDVSRLHRIQVLLGQGLNLVGIARVLQLEDDNQRLQTQLDQARQHDSQKDAPQRRGGRSGRSQA